MNKYLLTSVITILLGFTAVVNAQSITVTSNFDDGVMDPFLECTTKDPHYTRIEDGRVKTFWSSEGGWDGTRADKGAEMCIATDNFKTTKEGWYGFSMTLGDDYPVNKDAGIAQVFGFSANYYTWEAMLKMTNNELIMGYRGKGSEQPGADEITNTVILSAPERERTYNIIIHFILSANNNGTMEIWVDGENKMEHTGINLGFGTWVDDIQTCSECRTELKAGQYNYDYENWDYDETRTIYYDNVTMYNGSDGYTIVDPSYGEDLTVHNEFATASVTDDNNKQVMVELTENIAEYDSYEGFTVKVDSVVVAIDSVALFDSVHIAIYLTNASTNASSVTLSYEPGNILTESNATLISFEDTLVNNFLTGSAPVLESVETSENGLQLIISFNKKMELPTSTTSLLAKADYLGTKEITLSETAYYSTDSLSLLFTLSEKVYYDYLLRLSYDGTNIISIDDGALCTFSELTVTNNSAGLPFELESAQVDASGLYVDFEFNRKIADIQDQSENFTCGINDINTDSDYTVIMDSTIRVYLSDKIYADDVVTASYTPGSLVWVYATNNVTLDAFAGEAVENMSALILPTIPGQIEAEDYDNESGTVTEDCGEGGEDIGYIDTGDYTEYNVKVLADTTYKATFRVATKNNDCEITVFVDGNQKGVVIVPNTGAWQTYASSSIDMNLTSGEHTILLVFTGGFNINWMKFEETEPSEVVDSYYKIQAEDYNANYGTETETCTDVDEGENEGSINNGNWLMFSDINLSNVKSIDIRLASTKSDGTIQIKLGSKSGTLIGTVDIPNTGGWQIWETASIDIESVSGTYDVYLVFITPNSYAGNINWLQFYSNTTTAINQIELNEISIYPNPITDYLTIVNATDSNVEIFDIDGSLMSSNIIGNDRQSIYTGQLDSGIYFVKINSKCCSKTFKVTKQ
jgi:hypothetical protein